MKKRTWAAMVRHFGPLPLEGEMLEQGPAPGGVGNNVNTFSAIRNFRMHLEIHSERRQFPRWNYSVFFRDYIRSMEKI